MAKGIHKVRYGSKERMCFGKIDEAIDIPYLIEVQKDSYEWFVQEGLRRSTKRHFTNNRLHR